MVEPWNVIFATTNRTFQNHFCHVKALPFPGFCYLAYGMLLFFRCSSYSNSHCYSAWHFPCSHTDIIATRGFLIQNIMRYSANIWHSDTSLFDKDVPFGIMSSRCYLAWSDVWQPLGTVLQSPNELLQ